MRRLYLQDPLNADALTLLNEWQARMDTPPVSGDALWAVVDGAVLGGAGAEAMAEVYGTPVVAFHGTHLADYEELGILVWPLARMVERDGLNTLGRAVGAAPCLSVVRGGADADALCRTLTWLAGAATEDGMSLYLRIADTRVLASFLRHITSEQRSVLRQSVREWVLADRSGALSRGFARDESADSLIDFTGAGLVLDKAQYAALMQDSEPDMLHAQLKLSLPHLDVPHPSAKMHEWFGTVLGRAKAIGLTSPADHVAFAGLALRATGEFEAAPELAETWFKAKSSACSLNDAIGKWGLPQWQALERFVKSGANAGRT